MLEAAFIHLSEDRQGKDMLALVDSQLIIHEQNFNQFPSFSLIS